MREKKAATLRARVPHRQPSAATRDTCGPKPTAQAARREAKRATLKAKTAPRECNAARYDTNVAMHDANVTIQDTNVAMLAVALTR